MEKIPPVADSGDYMLEIRLLKGEEILNGFKVYGTVLNIPTVGGKWASCSYTFGATSLNDLRSGLSE